VTTGKIEIDKKKKIKGPITIQDPCNLVRLRGAANKLRYLVHTTCEDVVEMYPNREHNFCCNAGGGGAAIGPPWRGILVEGNKIKARQIEETGAKFISTPCHNCYTGINNIIKGYHLNVKAMFMDELITETMVIPEKLKEGS
jgi:Fe-S oxidoreductase